MKGCTGVQACVQKPRKLLKKIKIGQKSIGWAKSIFHIFHTNFQWKSILISIDQNQFQNLKNLASLTLLLKIFQTVVRLPSSEK